MNISKSSPPTEQVPLDAASPTRPETRVDSAVCSLSNEVILVVGGEKFVTTTQTAAKLPLLAGLLEDTTERRFVFDRSPVAFALLLDCVRGRDKAPPGLSLEQVYRLRQEADFFGHHSLSTWLEAYHAFNEAYRNKVENSENTGRAYKAYGCALYRVGLTEPAQRKIKKAERLLGIPIHKDVHFLADIICASSRTRPLDDTSLIDDFISALIIFLKNRHWGYDETRVIRHFTDALSVVGRTLTDRNEQRLLLTDFLLQTAPGMMQMKESPCPPLCALEDVVDFVEDRTSSRSFLMQVNREIDYHNPQDISYERKHRMLWSACDWVSRAKQALLN